MILKPKKNYTLAMQINLFLFTCRIIFKDLLQTNSTRIVSNSKHKYLGVINWSNPNKILDRTLQIPVYET